MEVGAMRHAPGVRRFVLILAAATTMAVTSLEPVGATVVERGHYADTFAFSYDDCGEWFLVRGDGVFNETKATRIEGNIFEFVSVEAGQPFVVEDSDGNVIIRDRGVIRRRILFDTEGDDVPGGIDIEFLSAEVHGPHPGFFTDFCDIVNDLIGL